MRTKTVPTVNKVKRNTRKMKLQLGGGHAADRSNKLPLQKSYVIQRSNF